MGRLPSFMAIISLVLLVAFAGQTTAHALEQTGWFSCSAHAGCSGEAEDPVGADTPSKTCDPAACPHLVVALPWVNPECRVQSGRAVDYPRLDPLWNDGPVPAIDHPPQVG